MNKKNLLVITAVSVALIGSAGMFFANSVFAESQNQKYPTVIQKLVEKFNLNTSEVDKVIAEVKTQRHAERKAEQDLRHKEMEGKLTQAVKEGKLTEVQKSKILSKLSEMQAEAEKNREEWQPEGSANLTNDQRKAKMEEKRNQMEKRKADFESWEKELGVDVNSILGNEWGFGFGGKGGKGFGQGYSSKH